MVLFCSCGCSSIIYLTLFFCVFFLVHTATMFFVPSALASLMPKFIIEQIEPTHVNAISSLDKPANVLDETRLSAVKHIHVVAQSPMQYYAAKGLGENPHMRVVELEEKNYLDFARKHDFKDDLDHSFETKGISKDFQDLMLCCFMCSASTIDIGCLMICFVVFITATSPRDIFSQIKSPFATCCFVLSTWSQTWANIITGGLPFKRGTSQLVVLVVRNQCAF